MDTVERSISCTEKVSRIYSPSDIGEEMNVSGFAFSRRLLKKTGLKREEIRRVFREGKKPFKHAELARKLASDSSGGPSVNENSIKIWINSESETAGSEADYIWMYFGPDKRLKLHGWEGKFPAGYGINWDLGQEDEWLEDNVKTDLWDEIALVTDSKDGIKIDRIRIIHSDQTILDWECGLWLDASKNEEYGRIVLTGKILETKLNQIDNLWVPQIHWGAREIGKSDGTKYGANPGEAWCSEFASWCLRKAMWDTPKGNIGSKKMANHFDNLDRMYTHDQLLDGDYRLTPGDYLRFEFSNGDQHSGIFIEYIGDPARPSESTTIRTIEGNSSSTVRVRTRDFQDILSVGSCQ